MLSGALTAGIMMVLLASLLAIILRTAKIKLDASGDSRIDEVANFLPDVNCGACGTPGCRSFAAAVVSGAMTPGKCTVNSAAATQRLARYMGIAAGVQEKRVARLACAGGSHVARQRARYEGLQTCRAASLVSGGAKGCAWGCLGLGDCVRACEFGAITLDAHSLPMVDTDKCIACNDCVEVCPKGLFSLHPLSHRLWVACKSLSLGEDADAECEVACNGCAQCVEDAPAGLVTMKDHLAVVDYAQHEAASMQVIQRCPTGAIVWLDDQGNAKKGKAAKSIPAGQQLPRLKEPAGLR